MKVRQDAWSEENDLLLAETVLRHVREGSTQLKAFEEVGDTLNRTSAACGFRWNAVVRKQYEKALGLARKQRKQSYRLIHKDEESRELHIVLESTQTSQNMNDRAGSAALTMSSVIDFLQNFNSSGQDYESLRKELEAVKQAKAALETKYEELEKRTLTIQEDYEAIVKIMDRARKMVVFGNEEDKGTSFKMESNGNLEKVAD
ncbi:RsfA family transcriptional regulator [Domibacillus sp. A3M-37]|uniref:RsfA family transcriptional regulator n=1 Tax=Domibacillus sp. A3M-37 TaxID=2962037 RepID=UPI0020B876FF|nr:RsfA family transcriptional regulator [Domibacillus sp. A3M-37]MCP3763784.1 RsfA family transcriptional regulator [Domibacillus sp. A3M-37]